MHNPAIKNTTKLFSLAIIFLTGCGGGGGGSPDMIGTPSPTKASVGRAIFFDTNLSSNANQSCASCHDPATGFADPAATVAAPVSEGSVPGAFGDRNAPTAAYASFSPDFRLTTTTQTSDDGSKYEGGQFLDGRRSNLVEQAKDPFLNPVEMNNTDAADVVAKVRLAGYAADFKTVFGATALDDVATAYDFIAEALATFETSSEVNPFSSKYDASLIGQYTMSASEANGLTVFTGTTAKCANCHVLTAPGERDLFTNFKYFNIGTPSNPGNPSTAQDLGLGAIVQEAGENGKFRTPTLRNVELTAPYMHNGVFGTLEEVVTHYDLLADGNLEPPEVNTNIASELNLLAAAPLGLSDVEKADLVAFMLTLTDGYIK